MAKTQENELYQYKNLLSQAQKTLSKSKTALTVPTKADLSQSVNISKLKTQLNQLQSDRLKKYWYGPPELDEKPEEYKAGLGSKLLHGLSTPLYGIMGGIESLLGKGTKSGLENIGSNIEEHGTAGDILRSYNVPWQISAPLGFAFDVLLDPINWATMGTTALIPRIAVGAGKGLAREGIAGAARGVEKAITSKALGIGSKASKLIPGIAKVEKQALATKAIKSAQDYKRFIGETPGEIKKTFLQKLWDKPIEKTGEALKSEKTPNFIKRIVDSLDPESQWLEKHMFEEKVVKEFSGPEAINKINDKLFGGTRYDNVLDMVDGKNANKLTSDVTSSGVDLNVLRRELNIGADLATDPTTLVESTGDDFARHLSAEAKREEMLQSFNRNRIKAYEGKTGVKWFDDVATGFRNIKIKDVDVGEKIAKAYATALGFFKYGKVPLNFPTSHMIAAGGNLTMAQMAGISFLGTDFLSHLKNSWKLLRGKGNLEFIKRLEKSGLQNYLEDFSETSRSILTINPKTFKEILKQLWWKMDHFLDLDMTYYSALSSGLDQIKKGTTTLIDHHASNYITGSLNQIRKALVDDLGIRALLAFETSDRFDVDESII